MGFQVVPALVVFHTPPEPTATYHKLKSLGSMAMSAIRPDINAGPIPLSCNPENVLSVNSVSLLPWAKIPDESITNIRVNEYLKALFITILLNDFSKQCSVRIELIYW
jgi:hypothetical protein